MLWIWTISKFTQWEAILKFIVHFILKAFQPVFVILYKWSILYRLTWPQVITYTGIILFITHQNTNYFKTICLSIKCFNINCIIKDFKSWNTGGSAQFITDVKTMNYYFKQIFQIIIWLHLRYQNSTFNFERGLIVRNVWEIS